MFSIQTITTFFFASLLLAIAPGPDNIFVLTQGMLHGRLAGLMVTLGLATGLILHTTLVALGVAVLFQTSILAFTLLKLLGAGYLLYLAWQALRSQEQEIGVHGMFPLEMGQLYRRGIIMNVTNPKVSLFFLAFLPQFTNPSAGQLSLQMIFLGGIFIIATLLVFGGVAIVAGQIGRWLTGSDQAQRNLNRLAGLVFVLLALKLLMLEQ
ncbi:MAG: LysE family translocator [Gammaproteobacteria bacterium]|nr:LysE family translocator [Gammaproteobacteria bacterium]